MAERDAEIIVIGAGIAGLAAARSLVDADYEVLVLEARDRLGGRIWTSNALGFPLDMGATWIHRVKGNPIYELAQQFKLKTCPTDYEELWLYDTNGRLIEDDKQDEIDDLLDDLEDEFEEWLEEQEAQDADEVPLQQAFEQVLQTWSLSRQDRRYLDYAVTSTIEHEFGTDISELSCYFDEGEEFDGQDHLFPQGYHQLVEQLVTDFSIKLEHRVTQIEYNSSGVTVTTNQGDFRCDRVVVTLPLGVLQQERVTFIPELPKRKRKAIQRLGMGVLNKVVLHFPEVFWPKSSHLLGYVPRQRGAWTEFLNGFQGYKQPVLVGFNAGSYGTFLESLTDEQIVAEMMQVLRTLFGDKIPDPIAWQITRWNSDPFACGSYSYLRYQADESDRDALAESVADRLFFAGEATSQDYPATVHGAFLSGERVAEQIDALY